MTIERPSTAPQDDWEKTPSSIQTLLHEAYEQIEALETNTDVSPDVSEERRPVTIIFADISGFTALNDAAKSPAEVERVIGLVNHLLQELSEAIYEFDGYIDKYIGDEIMAIFGAPKSHENDPELALRACLSMMERLKNFNANPPFPLAKPLGIHMGVNTGTVIAGMVGSDRKRSYTVMGDAVNVAARLESVSIRGEIFVSEDTYELTKRFFVFEKRDSVQVKGKEKPLQVYQLKSLRDRPLQPAERQAPFTGRGEEIKILTSMYTQLTDGEGGIVVLSSDAGMGKSRLVQELRTQVSRNGARQSKKSIWLKTQDEITQDDTPNPIWLFGRGLSYRRSLANRLFVDILHSYLGVSSNADNSLINRRLEAMGEDLFEHRKIEILPYIATMLGLTLDAETAENLPLNDPQALQQRMLLAIGEWVEALAERQPVVMVFEDLHWADSSSVELIEYLFTLTFYTPVLIICATRLERQSRFWEVKTISKTDLGDDITELTLWPLTAHECRQLITGMLNIDYLPKDVEGLLLERAEGNPLFLEEVLRNLIEQTVIQYIDGQWQITRQVTEVDIPNTLQGVFTSRIDRLKDDVKKVLQVAAVIGRVFPLFVLKPMVDDPSILDLALEELKTTELIQAKDKSDESDYMFKHVLAYETAYNSMLLGQRKVIHRRIGDYMSRLFFLRGDEFGAHAAEHYTKGEVWDRAFKYSKRAAEAAIQSFFNREAIEFYTRALDIAEKIPPGEFNPADLIDIYYGRARILARLSEPEKAIADYEAMLAKAKELNDVSAEFRALNGIGALHTNFDFSSAVELFQAALTVARRIGDKTGIADTLNQLGSFYINMGDLEKATHYYEEAQAMAIDDGTEAARIEAVDGLTSILVEQGDMIIAIQKYEEEIIPIRRRLGYRSGLIKSLVTLLRANIYIGNYEAADRIIEEIDQLYKKSSGDYYLAPLVRYHQALGQFFRGQFFEANENLQAGLKIANKQQQKGWQVLGLGWLSYCNLLLGMNEKSLAQAEQCNKLAMELGSPFYILHAQTVLGAAYRSLGVLDEAINHLENVANVAQKMTLLLEKARILYQLARAYIKAEQWDKANDAVYELSTLAQLNQMHEFTIRGRWLQSLIDTHNKKHQTALNMLAEASTLASQTDSRLIQYLIQIQKSQVYHLTQNYDASKVATSYADKIQQQLLDSLDETTSQSFLQGSHAHRLQKIIDLNIQIEAEDNASVGVS